MPLYKDNAQNKRLKRVGMGYGKECSPCKPKSQNKKDKEIKPPKKDKKIKPPKKDKEEKGKLKVYAHDPDFDGEYVTKEKFISTIEAKGYKFTPSQIKYIDRFLGSRIKIDPFYNSNSKNYIIQPVRNDMGLYKEEYKKRFPDNRRRILLKPI